MYDLSVVIPARSEQFLSLTVEDILKQKRGKTEVIVGLDGEWADPPLNDHPDLTILYYGKSIGQRAITNQCVKLSHAKYIMKIDAHCRVDEGFDVKMMSEMKDNYTMIPVMYNLHAFDWVCDTCGNRTYQSPTPEKCFKPECSGKPKREMIWKPRLSRKSEFYRFDTTLHFQYHSARKKQVDPNETLVETFSAQGSCFMLTRKKYWELNICDETHGSWGQQGTEIACKTWLSGGRLVTNRKTWYSHMFRTQGGDFGFPYPQSGRQVENARRYSRKLFIDNTWDKQIYPLSWLIEKFKPLPEWHEEAGKAVLDEVNRKGEEFYKRMESKHPDMVYVTPYTLVYDEIIEGTPKIDKKYLELTKGIVYYTDSRLNPVIQDACLKQLKKGFSGRIVSVSLKPLDFGDNIVLPYERGYYTMFRQILAGLEKIGTDITFLIDHDVLYHPTHFAFTPERKDVYYYNQNVWRVRVDDGHALHYHFYSGCCAYTETLIKHYRERIRRIEELISKNGECTTKDFLRMGFEAGTHTRKERIDDLKAEVWESKYPNIDIRHKGNLTSSRWSKDKFRSQRNCEGWEESRVENIQGWDDLPNLISSFK